MPCCSCVEKLAYKLMSRHKIDMIRAYELAEKAVERVENRKSSPAVKPLIKKGNPTDYTQPCTQGTCTAVGTCANCKYIRPTGYFCVPTCRASGGCGCPAALPNSHVVGECSVTCEALSGTCTKAGNPCVYNSDCADGSCQVVDCTTGHCNYDCNTGYQWNPATGECEAVVIHPVGGVVPQAKLNDII